MDPRRKIAVAVGVLFIIATAAPVVSLPFFSPMNTPGFLVDIAARGNLVVIGALLEVVMAFAIAAIAIVIHPVLKRYNETLAFGYAASRLAEAVLFLAVAVISLLLLLTLSRNFAAAGAPDDSSYRTFGTILKAAHDQAYLVGGRLVFPVSALILNYALYRSRLIARWLSLWGLGGAVLLLVGAVLGMLGAFEANSVWETVSFLPIAVQEMVFAVWLIARGFRSPAAVDEPAWRQEPG